MLSHDHSGLILNPNPDVVRQFETARFRGAAEAISRQPYRGRLAPTPSGELHLGHAQTFWIAYQRSLSNFGDLVLRIEDLDGPRCKSHFYELMYQTILWFGIKWTFGPAYCGKQWGVVCAAEESVPATSTADAAQTSSAMCKGGEVGPFLQSERKDLYLHAWKILYESGLIYPSVHSRRQIEALSAPHEGEGESIFPPSLRCNPSDIPAGLCNPDGKSWRFRVPDGESISFTDGHAGPQSYVAGLDFGDFLVWRFDGFPSYEMAVVVDDLAMGITEIVRGEDLLMSTARQMLLYRAFGIPDANLPNFFHCPLVRDPETGKRLAKREGARSMRVLQESGWTPEKLREKLCCFDGVVL